MTCWFRPNSGEWVRTRLSLLGTVREGTSGSFSFLFPFYRESWHDVRAWMELDLNGERQPRRTSRWTALPACLKLAPCAIKCLTCCTRVYSSFASKAGMVRRRLSCSDNWDFCQNFMPPHSFHHILSVMHIQSDLFWMLSVLSHAGVKPW